MAHHWPKVFLYWHSTVLSLGQMVHVLYNNINCLLTGSRCIPNDAHTSHFRANLAHASKRIKISDYSYYYLVSLYTLTWYGCHFFSCKVEKVVCR